MCSHYQKQYREQWWRSLWFCVCTIAAAMRWGSPSTPSTSSPCHRLYSYEILSVPWLYAVVMGVREAPTCAKISDGPLKISAYLDKRNNYKLMCYLMT